MGKIKKYIGGVLRRNVVSLSLLTLSGLFVLVLFSDKIFISIPAGSAGVLWQRFHGGTNVTDEFPEGFHIIFPWNRMHIYNVRLKEASNTISVLAKDGLEIKVEFLVRYRPRAATLGFLHKNMGEDYLKILIMPEVNSKIRQTMALYEPEQIYSSKRQEIQEKVQVEAMKELKVAFSLKKIVKDPKEKRDVAAKYDDRKALVFIDDVLLKTITLPKSVRKAIEAKVEHKHRMLQYIYILDRERQESIRKEIEATGISKFQQIVKNGISDRYLRWKGIDATLELAKSNNSKIVIIGAGKEGMPLILGNMGAQPSIASPSEKVGSGTLDAPLSEDKRATGEKSSTAVEEQEKSLTQRALDSLSIMSSQPEPATTKP